MPLALLALAIGAFGIGTTEFVIAGLLPQVAADFSVSIPTAGYLISGYALAVTVGALPMTVLGTRMRRKHLLLALMVVFIAGNALSALAPGYGMMMAGRIVAAFCHGAFFGVGSVVAADLVAPDRRASALAFMFTGLTLANVIGVPMGTFLGQSFGWRSTFWVVAALGVVGLIGIATLVPSQPRPATTRIGVELAALRNPQVWLSVATTALGFGGLFASFTYIAPMMTEVAGFSEGTVSWLLVLFGVGLVIGNLLGGRFADRALMPSLYLTLAGLALVLAVFTLTARAQVPAMITIFLLGVFGFATVPPLQTRMLDNARNAPTVASAVNIGAFNLGNALAAWLGGLAITSGLGYTAPNWVGALLVASAVGVTAVSALLDRRATTSAARRPEAQPV